MSTVSNATLVRHLFAIFNQCDATPLSEVLAPTFVFHEPDTLIQGVAGVSMLRQAFPDVRYAIDGDIIVSADTVVTRWTASGHHQGAVFGIPPTGKRITWTGITIWRIDAGKVVEAWVSRDMLGLLQQVGAVPALGASQR
jgi:predicted ester cyclase